MTNAEPRSTHGNGFLVGVVAGGILGTAITCYFATRLTADLRLQITDSVRRFRRSAAEHLEQVSSGIADAADEVADTPPAVADDSRQRFGAPRV
jgi:gas vesicle protein